MSLFFFGLRRAWFCCRVAEQSLDRDRQHSPRRGEGGHNFWCPAIRCLALPSDMPAITVMVETPGALVVEKSSLSLQCPSLHLRRVDFIAPVPALSPVQAKYTARCLWLRTSILSVGCAHFDSLKAALTPSCVGLGWSCSVGDVMFSRIQPCFFCLQHLCARRWRSSVFLFRTQFQSAKVVRCATPSSSDLWSVMLASCSAVDMPALLSV